jgi:hypothetical protein
MFRSVQCLIVILLGVTGMLFSENTVPKKGTVLVSERPEWVYEFRVNDEEMKSLFRRMLLQWTGESDLTQAWRSLGIRPGEVVGIKISTAGGSVIASRHSLVEEIASELLHAGAKEVVVWDKYAEEMNQAGYRIGESKRYRLESVIPGAGFDETQFYLNEYLGRLIWGDHLFKKKVEKEDLLKMAEDSAKPKEEGLGGIEDQTSNKSYFAKLVTTRCQKIVNLSSFIDHDVLGVWGCCSSLAMSSVDNTRRFTNSKNAGDPAVAEILDRDLFRKKVVLHVMDGMVAQFAGGPLFTPHFAKPLGFLMMGQDPVAIDTLVVDQIQKGRKIFKVVPITDEARHLKGCADAGLGESDLKKVKVIRAY